MKIEDELQQRLRELRRRRDQCVSAMSEARPRSKYGRMLRHDLVQTEADILDVEAQLPAGRPEP